MAFKVKIQFKRGLEYSIELLQLRSCWCFVSKESVQHHEKIIE